MTNAHKFTLAVCIVLAVFVACVGYGWVKEHESNSVLAAQQKADKDAAAQIAEREKVNQQQLAETLKSFAAMKQQMQTPAQIVKALPQVVSVPAPIVQVTAAQVKAVSDAALPEAPKLSEGDLIIPAQSVKSFYDAQVDCKANEARLASCQITTANQNGAAAVKDAEIAQLKAALKGGTKWQRAKAAVKFISVGAAIGAATSAYFLTR
jgi:hypothetical protein